MYNLPIIWYATDSWASPVGVGSISSVTKERSIKLIPHESLNITNIKYVLAVDNTITVTNRATGHIYSLNKLIICLAYVESKSVNTDILYP